MFECLTNKQLREAVSLVFRAWIRTGHALENARTNGIGDPKALFDMREDLGTTFAYLYDTLKTRTMG